LADGGDSYWTGIAQHHDVVSGTAKQHATNDYEKCLAIGVLEVSFLEPSDGRTTFKCLAHKICKYLPLYLEWVPDDILSEDLTYKKDDHAAMERKVELEHRALDASTALAKIEAF
ncbi:multiple RNA-binding domain-containing protein 1 isoform X1, partial [Tanacetum coccineum]